MDLSQMIYRDVAEFPRRSRRVDELWHKDPNLERLKMPLPRWFILMMLHFNRSVLRTGMKFARLHLRLRSWIPSIFSRNTSTAKVTMIERHVKFFSFFVPKKFREPWIGDLLEDIKTAQRAGYGQLSIGVMVISQFLLIVPTRIWLLLSGAATFFATKSGSMANWLRQILS